MEKKTILYIDNGISYLKGSKAYAERIRKDRVERYSAIRQGLEKNFIVDTSLDLSGSDVININKNLNGRYGREKMYSALVSHFPYDADFLKSPEAAILSGKKFLQGLYRRSSKIIKQIRTSHSNFPMLAYTGADTKEADDNKKKNMEEVLLEAGFNDIVWKSRNVNEDAQEITEKLFKIAREQCPNNIIF